MAENLLEERVRTICLSLPGVTERRSHGSPAFFARKQFVALWSEGHHEREFPHMWCAAPLGAQESLIETSPKRYFRPPYVGSRGWLGVRLDGRVNWSEIASLCEDAFRTVAPKMLVLQLDGSIGRPKS